LESNFLSKEAKLPLNQGQLTKQKLGKERARKTLKPTEKKQQHNSKTRQAQNSKESSPHATQCIDNIN
jgi:hypothetical protein